MSINAPQPLFAPRLAGAYLFGVASEEARWFHVVNITSIGADGCEITFRLSEDAEAVGYVAGRTPDPDSAQRELFELLLMLDTSTQPDDEEV